MVGHYQNEWVKNHDFFFWVNNEKKKTIHSHMAIMIIIMAKII